MVISGGDSLEENFVIGSDSESNADSQESLKHGDNTEFDLERGSDHSSCASSNEDRLESDSIPKSKKVKLDWREGAISHDGSVDSQRHMLQNLLVAVEKYFPSHDTNLGKSAITRLGFADCRDLMATSTRSVSDTLRFLRDNTTYPRSSPSTSLSTIIISGSASRAMFLIKELRSFDSKLTPLPLFYHGGGRKKEQSKTHESVLKGKKSTTVVALPSRLKSVCEQGLVDFEDLGLIVFDLKPNEKMLNVLSQKETLLDVLQILELFVLPNATEKLRIALV